MPPGVFTKSCFCHHKLSFRCPDCPSKIYRFCHHKRPMCISGRITNAKIFNHLYHQLLEHECLSKTCNMNCMFCWHVYMLTSRKYINSQSFLPAVGLWITFFGAVFDETAPRKQESSFYLSKFLIHLYFGSVKTPFPAVSNEQMRWGPRSCYLYL